MPDNNNTTSNFAKTVDAAKEFVFSMEPENLALSDPFLPDANKKAILTGFVDTFDGKYGIRAEVNLADEEVVFCAFPGVLILPEYKNQLFILMKLAEKTVNGSGCQRLEENDGWLCSKQTVSIKNAPLAKEDFRNMIASAASFCSLFKEYFAKMACGSFCDVSLDEYIKKKTMDIIDENISEFLHAKEKNSHEFDFNDKLETRKEPHSQFLKELFESGSDVDELISSLNSIIDEDEENFVAETGVVISPNINDSGNSKNADVFSVIAKFDSSESEE